MRILIISVLVALTAIAMAALVRTYTAEEGKPPYERGAMTGFVMHREAVALPDLAFRDADGAARSIADWRGRVVLLNLWATWCAPCREEMPALDALQAELGGEQFEVVAVSVDRKGLEASAAFLKETGADHLKLYIDETFKIARDLKTVGLPSTVLIDRQGREVGRLVGPADWDSDDAVRLVQGVIGERTAVQ